MVKAVKQIAVKGVSFKTKVRSSYGLLAYFSDIFISG